MEAPYIRRESQDHTSEASMSLANRTSRRSLVLASTALTAWALAALAPSTTAQCGPVETKKLTQPVPEDFAFFGLRIALDGERAIVGAPSSDVLDPGGYPSSGAAHVFERDLGGAGNWGLAASLVPLPGGSTASFGNGVAISGDLALAGDPEYDVVGGSSDAAFLFARDQGGAGAWGQVKLFQASDRVAGNSFGAEVALDGDFAIIGASGTSIGGAASAGAAYIFARDQGGAGAWGEVKKLVAFDAAAFDSFGAHLALEGSTVIIGAGGHDNLDGSSGAAYLFERDTGGVDNWGLVKQVIAPDGAAGRNFASDVDVSGDLALVGATLDDDQGSNAGAAYLFARDQGGTDNWGLVTKLFPSDPVANGFFGGTCSLQGDVAVVGASSFSVGAAYVFVRNAGGSDQWGQVARLTASDGGLGFGDAVANDGEDVMVGATIADVGSSTASGAAYLFEFQGVASAIPRNAGTNPASLTANAPVLGGMVTANVDLTTTGHTLAWLVGFDSPFTYVFTGGQTLLCLDLGGSGELLGAGAMPGPLASWSIALPIDLALCGFEVCVQALHFGGVVPFALSNALDCVIGTN